MLVDRTVNRTLFSSIALNTLVFIKQRTVTDGLDLDGLGDPLLLFGQHRLAADFGLEQGVHQGGLAQPTLTCTGTEGISSRTEIETSAPSKALSETGWRLHSTGSRDNNAEVHLGVYMYPYAHIHAINHTQPSRLTHTHRHTHLCTSSVLST